MGKKKTTASKVPKLFTETLNIQPDGYGVFISVSFNGCSAWGRLDLNEARKAAKILVECADYQLNQAKEGWK